MNTVKTVSQKMKCMECDNEIDLSQEQKQVGDIVECSFCGVEYEVINKEGEELELKILEEEK